VQRPLSTLALGARLASGVAFVLAPRALGGVMIGPGAAQPGTRLFVQAFGARDAILGAGGLAARARGESSRPWLFASATADAADAVLGGLLFRKLPAGRRVLVVGASSVPAVLNLAAALGEDG
jgi:hypothetical protein